MNLSMTAEEERRFDAWVHSPTVHSKDRDELIIAFKISKQLNLVPSKVLKALRGREGPDEKTIAMVEELVAASSALEFFQSAPDRLVKGSLQGRPPRRRCRRREKSEPAARF